MPSGGGTRPEAYTLFASGGTALGLNVFLDTPIWTGSQSTAWDTASANWNLASSGGTTTFYTADAVSFTDTATNTTVAINSGNVAAAEREFQ